MEGQLTGRVAVVTGGGRGVGRAIADALADAGAAVAVLARTENEITLAATEIERRRGRRALAVAVDVTNERGIRAAVDQVERALGPIDVLVNNAGTCNALGSLWEVDPDEWWRDVEVNLRGTFLTTWAILPGMLDRDSGRIINVSSYAAIRPDPYRSAYASAKLAILRLTDSLAAELAGSHVVAFAMTPGTVRSAMTEQLAQAAREHEWPVDWSTRPTEAWVPPERAAELAVFLASGRGDALAGRFLHALDDVPELVRQADTILQRDLYAVRLQKP